MELSKFHSRAAASLGLGNLQAGSQLLGESETRIDIRYSWLVIKTPSRQQSRVLALTKANKICVTLLVDSWPQEDPENSVVLEMEEDPVFQTIKAAQLFDIPRARDLTLDGCGYELYFHSNESDLRIAFRRPKSEGLTALREAIDSLDEQMTKLLSED